MPLMHIVRPGTADGLCGAKDAERQTVVEALGWALRRARANVSQEFTAETLYCPTCLSRAVTLLQSLPKARA